MRYFLTGSCKSCGQRVWVNLDGSCAAGHADDEVSALEVHQPEQLDVDELMRLMQGNRDQRWVEGTNLADGGRPEQTYEYLSKLEPKVTNAVDLHFVYNGLIDATYRLRDQHPNWLAWCIEYCNRDIALFPRFRSGWLADERLGSIFTLATSLMIKDKRGATESMKRATSKLPFDLLVPSFKQLTIIYEKQGRFAEALTTAQLAESYGLRDGTKGGYSGRIARLEKKASSS